MSSLLLRTTFSLGIFLVCIFTFFDPAISQKENIGVVEVQLIMKDSLAAKSIQSQIEKRRSIYESAVVKEEKRLRELEQEISRQRSLLTPEAFNKKKQEFETQVTAHKRNVRERRRILDQAYASGVRQLQQKLAEIIAAIARDRDILLVLPASQVLFGEVSLLLTREALEALDERLPSVDLNLPTD